MAGKFVLKKFANIDLNDAFFDSLKTIILEQQVVQDLLIGLGKNLQMERQPLFLKMR